MARSASKVLVIGGCPRLGKTTLAKSVSKLIGDAHVVHGDAIMAAIRSAGGLVPRTPPGQWNDLEGTWARTLERDRAVTQAMVAAVRELAHYVGYEAIVAEGAYVPGNPMDMLADELSVAEIVLVNTDEDIDAEVARLRRINEADPSSWLRRYDDDLLADYARATLHRNQSPYSLPNHHCPGFLVRHGDAKLMLDCGSGTHSALSMPDDLNGLGIVISHMHLDHCSDIGSIQYASYVFHEHRRLSAPVDIWIPRRPEARNVVVNEPIAYATYHGIDEGTAFDFHGLHVDFCRTDHFMECYATRVSDGRATVVYTGDLAFSCHGRIAEFSHGADLLVCESSLLDS